MTVIRSHPARRVLAILGQEPAEIIARAGLIPAAVETLLFHPQDRVRRRAVVCRLYPHTDKAKLAFLRNGSRLAEATVFPDPDDDLEISLLEGFNAAILAAAHVLAPGDHDTEPDATDIPDMT